MNDVSALQIRFFCLLAMQRWMDCMDWWSALDGFQFVRRRRDWSSRWWRFMACGRFFLRNFHQEHIGMLLEAKRFYLLQTKKCPTRHNLHSSAITPSLNWPKRFCINAKDSFCFFYLWWFCVGICVSWVISFHRYSCRLGLLNLL